MDVFSEDRLDFVARSINAIKAPSISRREVIDIDVDQLLSHALAPFLKSDRHIRIAIPGFSGNLVREFGHGEFIRVCRMIPVGRAEFIPVGSKPGPSYQSLIDQYISNGLPFNPNEFYNTDEFANGLKDKCRAIDGVYCCVPTDAHFPLLTKLLQHPYGTIIIEKPVVLPRELDDFTKLKSQHGDRLLDVDFFSTSAPMYWLLSTQEGQELLRSFGIPVVINGSMLERQEVASDRGGGAGGLRSAEKNGGGIYMDMSPHLAHMIATLLHRMNDLTVERFIPQAAFFYSYDDLHIHNTDIRETFGAVQHRYQDKLVNFQAGKGLDRNQNCLEFFSEEGNHLIINLVKGSPSIIFHSRDGLVRKYRFEGAGYGYDFALARIFSAVSNPEHIVYPARKVDAAVEAVRQANAAWEINPNQKRHQFGSMPDRSIPLPNLIGYGF